MISTKILELIAKAENVSFHKNYKKNERKYKLYCKQYKAFNSIKMTLEKNKVHTIKRKLLRNIKFLS